MAYRFGAAPRPRKSCRTANYPRAASASLITLVGMGLASSCGGAPGGFPSYDAGVGGMPGTGGMAAYNAGTGGTRDAGNDTGGADASNSDLDAGDAD